MNDKTNIEALKDLLLLEIKRIFRRFGIDISFYRYSRNNIYQEQLINSLKTNNIDLIIDVGANTGQFAEGIIKAGYTKEIISIEPLSDAYEQILRNSQHYKNWKVFPRMALGSKNQNGKINISQNSVSSSLLNILPTHLNAAPQSKYIKTESVSIHKLDNFIKEFKKYNNILLKIDAQGYESYILQGGKKLLNSTSLIKGILIEVSYIELYKKQKTFDYFYKLLTKMGFTIWSTQNVFNDNAGKTLQADVLMYR